MKKIGKKCKRNNLILISMIILIPIMGVGIGLVVGQGGGRGQEELDGELANLTNELIDSGYSWLVNYSGELPAVEPAEIEVYTEDSDSLITKFTNITDESWYKVLLTEFVGSHDVFDLKIIGDK